VLALLQNDAELLAIADAVASTQAGAAGGGVAAASRWRRLRRSIRIPPVSS